ncbi:MAG: T9SS type A sorting domain-containing protein [Bacteroidota bacterium]
MLLSSVSLKAQMNYEWLGTHGGPNYSEFGLDITCDDSGNVFMVGEFLDQAVVADSFFPTTEGNSDLFLAKFDPHGAPQWIQSLGSDQIDRVYAVNSGLDDHLYITGYGKVVFPARTSLHARDALIARFRANGEMAWGLALDGDVLSEGKDIVGDENGNCYVAGQMETTSWLGADTLVGNGARDGWLGSFDSTGNLRWWLTFGGTGDDDCWTLGRDGEGALYVGGSFNGTATFGTTSLVSQGGRDAFVAKYDSNGVFQWARGFHGSMDNATLALKVSKDGSCYFTGEYMDSLFVPGDTLVSSNFVDIFYGKMDRDGNLLWAKSAGGTNRDVPQDLEIDAEENVYIGGYFFGTLDFDTASVVSAGFDDMYFCKLDSNGNMLAFGSSHFPDTRDVFGVGVDPAQNILLSGAFSQEMSFGTDTIQAVSNSIDIFAAKFSTLPFSAFIDSVTGSPFCGDDEFWVHFTVTGAPADSNRFYLELSDANGSFANPDTVGIYSGAVGGSIMGTIPASIVAGTGYRLRVVASAPAFISPDNGTDITLDPATAIPVDITGDTLLCNGLPVVLEVDQGFVSQVWSNGDTNYFIVVTQPGQYSVEAVDSNGCSNQDFQVVSSCISAPEPEEPPLIQYFPNPADDQLIVESQFPGRHVLVFYDLHGRAVLHQDFVASQKGWRKTLNLAALPAGIYLLRVQHQHRSASGRLLIRR